MPSKPKPRYRIFYKMLADRRLNPVDLVVFSVIEHKARKTGMCHITLRSVGDVCGVSYMTVDKAIERLEECGYVTSVMKGGKRSGTDIFVDYEKVDG